MAVMTALLCAHSFGHILRVRSSGVPRTAVPACCSTSAPVVRSAGKHLSPEQKSAYVRPPGWKAPGPPPAGDRGRHDLRPQPGEDVSYLTGDWRIFQLKQGHRWSLDDMITAYVALQQVQAAEQRGLSVVNALDLGCGIGSVLMMVAWGLPHVRCTGVEAQPASATLARRSVAYNGCEGRVEVRQGDFRTMPDLVEAGRGYDLITGTPPYLPVGAGPMSQRPQKEPCCFETRGGIEDYCLAAAKYLAADGQFVVCSGIQGQPPGRTERAAVAAGLAVTRRVTVVPRAGKPPLLTVHVMVPEAARPAGSNADFADEVFVVRLADSSLSEEMHLAREVMGMPPLRRYAAQQQAA